MRKHFQVSIDYKLPTISECTLKYMIDVEWRPTLAVCNFHICTYLQSILLLISWYRFFIFTDKDCKLAT